VLRPDQISNIVFNCRSDNEISDAYQQTTTAFQKHFVFTVQVCGSSLRTESQDWS